MSGLGKGLWFVAGSAAGAYGATRLRRAAEALTYDGMHDRLSGLFAGARIFVAEVKAGAAAKETELRERLAIGPAGDSPAPSSAPPRLVKGDD
ncbi:MAG: DUF6167 family protein [Nocardioidaceae bacterium]